MMSVCVLMSTYNGAAYLEQQLDSIFLQKNVDAYLLVRDDGSTDSTKDILEKYSKKLTWYTGENLKTARSFWDLIMKAPDTEYYAFADQDDIWELDKLESACHFLKGSTKPALYFSQTQLVDSKLNPIKTKKICPKCTFEESIMDNYATGCTFVFNRALMKLIGEYNPSFLSMHDYWIYHLCLIVGGEIFFDPISHIKYRQHNHNVIGLSKGWKTNLQRRYQRIVNNKCERSRTVNELYKGYADKISPDILPLVKSIVNYKHSIKSKFFIIFNPKLRVPKITKNLSMRLAVLINRF